MTFVDRLINRENPSVSELQAVFMIVGLGNPGREYRETRHNIGFMVVDSFAAKHEIKLSKVQNKAIVGIGKIGDKKVILVKPQTYMNLSGQAVSALVRFYKIPLSNLVVAHDDVDLPFGAIRMRPETPGSTNPRAIIQSKPPCARSGMPVPGGRVMK